MVKVLIVVTVELSEFKFEMIVGN